jgi:hypothetical protein
VNPGRKTNTGNEYGNLEDTVDVVEQQNNGPYLNTIENFIRVYIYIYIYICSNKLKGNLVLNDNLCELSNPIFEGCGR